MLQAGILTLWSLFQKKNEVQVEICVFQNSLRINGCMDNLEWHIVHYLYIVHKFSLISIFMMNINILCGCFEINLFNLIKIFVEM